MITYSDKSNTGTKNIKGNGDSRFWIKPVLNMILIMEIIKVQLEEKLQIKHCVINHSSFIGKIQATDLPEGQLLSKYIKKLYFFFHDFTNNTKFTLLKGEKV